MPPAPDSFDDHRFAAELATAAGRLLMELRAELVASGVDPTELRAQGDRRSHALLMERLSTDRPGDAVLSEEGDAEEGPGGRSRLEAERVWIIDPLDGTREYGEVPRADWAVHVALVIGGRPAAGAVALPAQRITLGTRPPAPMPPPPPSRPRVIVSRSRPPAVAASLAEALGGDLVEMGSAGAKVAAVVMGAADVYAHSGGQYEWDSAAPVAVAAAAGLHVSRLDGSPLVYNNANPYLPTSWSATPTWPKLS
ncbi:MAG: 3'(2'),5'-bisphosphate nucleotidase CysQ [Acidimicrobiales bacterium]